MQQALLSYKTSKSIKRVLTYVGLVFLAIVCFLPFFMMIINATHSTTEINQGMYVLPGDSTADNYSIIQTKLAEIPGGIWRGFLNSVIITIPSVLLNAYFGALTAYGFSKFNFKGNRTLFWILLATMMIPQQLGLIGYFELNRLLGLLDTFIPLIVPSIAAAGTVFFIKMYIDSTVTDSLLDAARIDGSSEFYTFNRIILPIISPAIATQAIFAFVYSWNNYITPLVLLFSQTKFPMPVLISMVRGLYEANFGAIYLAVAISIVPIIIVFMFASKYIIGGLTLGSVKG